MRSLSVLLLLVAPSALAASGGPDTYGYYYADSNTVSSVSFDSDVVTEVVASGTILGTAPSTGASYADDASTALTLPFTFSYYGTDRTTAYVSTNGTLAFTSYSSLSNTALSSASTALIAPFWDDLDSNASASFVYSYTTGTTPNRTLTVLWYRTTHFNDTSAYGEITFGVQLHETSNDITMFWDDVVFEGTGGSSFSYGLSATVGIDGGSTTGYYTQLSHNAITYLADDKAVRFSTSPMFVAATVSDSEPDEGESVTLTADVDVLSGSVSLYEFDCEGDGTFESSSTSTDSVVCDYADDGDYTAVVRATHSGGTTRSATVDVAVANVAPTPVDGSISGFLSYTLSGLTYTVLWDEGDTMVVNCEATDVAGDTVTILHDFGNGDTGSADSLEDYSYVWPDNGSFYYDCTASDEDGGTSTGVWDSVGYVVLNDVSNVDPDIDAASASGGSEVTASTFSVTASDAGSDDTHTYAWDFGDGNTSTDEDPSHSYADAGTYAWSVTVTDDDGGSASSSGSVTVSDVAPSISALSVGTAGEGSALSVSATASAGPADTLSYAWSFGDGATGTGASATHTYADNGSYTVTLVVTDDDGGSASSSSTAVVTNVAPTASISGPSSSTEGASASFTGSASDPGTLDTFTYAWDFGDGGTATGDSVSHTFTSDGTYTVTLTVTDKDGGVGTTTSTVVVGNAAPVISSYSNPGSVDEGSSTALVVAATDAGGDAITYAWDFGDGESGAGDSVSHAWRQDGTYTVTVTATDDSGDATSESFVVVVDNVAPVVVSISGTDGDEGAALAFAGSATDAGLDDVLSYDWEFGDGIGSGESLTHAFSDEGTYDVKLSVSDDAGAIGEDSVLVTITNVAPSIDSTPDGAATESMVYSYAPTAVEPGADTLTWTLTSGPAGATVDAATGALAWTPTYADSLSPVSFELGVDDGDGGTDSQSWTVTVGATDTDGDGLADGYETANGFDPNDGTDAAGDADADGVSNLDESLDGTDPNVFDGPSAPLAVSPIDGEDVTSPMPDLVVAVASSPRGWSLTYDYEVYTDDSLSTLVTSVTGVAESAVETSWPVDVVLSEDTSYVWRARAHDGLVSGDWTEPEDFFVNEVDTAPTAPTPFSPVGGDLVATATPDLTWTQGADAEGRALDYDVEVWDASGTTLVASQSVQDVDPAEVYGMLTLSTALSEDQGYLWQVRATDESGAASDWSAPADFFVSLGDDAPSAALWVTPTDGETLETVTPELSWTEGVDPEGTVMAYEVLIDTVASFDSGDLLSVESTTLGYDLVANGQALPENTMVYLAVRSRDQAGFTSDWDVIAVNSRGENDAPGVPTLVAPAEAEEVGATPMLVVTETTDPEGDAITYELQVSASADLSSPVATTSVAASGTGEVSATLADELEPGEWFWSARAVDDQGAASEWAATGSFTVAGAVDTGIVDDSGDTDGGVDTDDKDGGYAGGGCGCDTDGAALPGAVAAVIAGLAVTRRRR